MERAVMLWVTCALMSSAQTITPLSNRMEGLLSPALSPDGTTLAYGSDGDVSDWIDVRSVSGGKAVHFAGRKDEGLPYALRWAPEGKRIAFLRYYCHSCNHKLFVKDFPEGRRSCWARCAAALHLGLLMAAL